MIVVIFLFSIVMQSVDCHGNDRLARVPLPQTDFDLHRYLGDWFTQSFLVPRSISGFQFYSDYISRYILEPNGVVSFLINYRTPRCVTNVNDYFPQDVPGVFFLKDSFGDTATGTSIVVATDYVTFAIKWGCPQPIVKGFCNDPYIVAKTRKPHPGPRTMRIVEDLYLDLFGVRLMDTTLYSHDNTCPNPFGRKCRAAPNPLKYRG